MQNILREFFENLPHNRFDIVSKDIFGTFTEDLLRKLTNIPGLKFVEQLETELTTVEIRRMDILSKVKVDDREVLVHIEFQVSRESTPEILKRKVGYFGRCFENTACRFCLSPSISVQMPVETTRASIVKIFQGIML